MTLQPEQFEQVKQQIINHVQTTFPEDKKSSAIEQINSMNEQQLEEFLVQNNLIKSGESQEQCIFCSILSGNIPSHKIDENETALAVLEINPLSRGHTMIIPKEHLSEISGEVEEFAKKLSLKLKKKLGAREIHKEESEMFGHKVMNLIPIYDDETLKGKRQPAPKDSLEILQTELTSEPEKIEEKEPEPQEEITDENTWLPKRFP